MNPTVSTISEAKRAANKANSAASTGPRTPEGKNRSRYNRLGHGLASPIAVLPCENQDEYDHLLSTLVDDYQPQTSVEEALVKQIADAQWKLRRLEKLEAGVFSAMLVQSQNEPTGSPADPFEAIASALLKPGKCQSALGLLARYQSTLNRQFLSAVKELRALQQQREKQHSDAFNAAMLRYIAGPRAKHQFLPQLPVTRRTDAPPSNAPGPRPPARQDANSVPRDSQTPPDGTLAA